jgi:uncharacterized protein (TIGR02594 family)
MSLASLVGSNLYRLNASGDTVRAIQIALAKIGYALKGTGWFGPATDVAVEAFQKRAGLKVDGVVGSATAGAIDLAISSAPMTTGIVVPHLEVSRPLWVEAGVKLLGTKEVAGAKDNPVIIDWAREEGGMIAREYHHDLTAWCALYANHILTKVALKGTETLWALDFADVHKWPCVKLAGPAVGAFAPMSREGGGHITVVVGRDKAVHIMGLGGNQSDAVTIEPFAISRLNKGYFWPAGVPLPVLTGISHLPIIASNGRVSTNEA